MVLHIVKSPSTNSMTYLRLNREKIRGITGTGKGHAQSKETDEQPGVDDRHIVTLRNIGQNTDKAHLRIKDAKHPCH